jgi:hypothetical protein
MTRGVATAGRLSQMSQLKMINLPFCPIIKKKIEISPTNFVTLATPLQMTV